MSELLVRKYGAKDTAKALLEHYGIDLNKMSDLETERVFIMGQMLGWQQNFKKANPPPPESALPVFDYGPYEPIGHMKNFIDECWNGWWKWSEVVSCGTANYRVVNHFASRVFYDLVNRRPGGSLPASYNMVCGPTSSGKTADAALYAVTMMFVFRKSMQIKLVSTTAGSAEDRVFGVANHMFENSYYGKNPLVGDDGKFSALAGDKRLLYMLKGEKISDTGKTQEKFMKDTLRGIQLNPVQRGAEGQGAVRRLMGIKAPQKLLITDEAGDCDPSIFAENLLINWSEAVDFSQAVYLWNPKLEARKAVSYLEPENGWNDERYNLDSPGWPTKRGGWCTSLIGTDTPNREWRKTNDPKRRPRDNVAPFPYIISITSIEAAEKKCPEGRDSAAFYQMAVGFLPDESKANTVLTYRGIQDAKADQEAHWTGEGSYYLFGVDPNLSGGDKFCICIGKMGYGLTPEGKRKVFLEIERFRYAPFIRKEHGSAEAGQVRWFQELAAEFGIGSECIASDCTGTSMSFVNATEIAMGGRMFHRVHFAASPSTRIAGPGETRTAEEKFVDAKSEICYSVRDYLPFIRGLVNEEACNQGCARTFEIKGRDKIVVENKHDFKLRMGGSPDEFDALSILVDLAKTMGLGTETLAHPLVAQGRLGRAHRIVTRAQYRSGVEERVGMARYGIAS